MQISYLLTLLCKRSLVARVCIKCLVLWRIREISVVTCSSKRMHLESWARRRMWSRAVARLQTAQQPPRSLPCKQGLPVVESYLDYNLQHSERAALAMLYCFCLRLHSEQLGYIYKFLERHLSLCNTIRMPQTWQESLDPEEDTSKQRTYKRVSISCHLTYMMLTKHDTTVAAIDVLDRTPVFPFHNPDTAPSPTGIYPVRASTSAMLTIVVPELTNNAPEHVDLLRNPQGLWTVLAVNVPPGLGVDQGAHAHLTPISQYFRAISTAIITARIHQQAIVTAIKDKLRSQEAGSLIDDEEFTRSNLYHWSVRTCDELQTQNAATLKFLRRTITTHVAKLHREAHSSEEQGVDHWRARLDEEIFQLDDLQSQILALKIQVQEDRNAMHQVMSVMETRAALQASERTKTLSYLARLYLPLSASASIYSMSVLPSSTTLYSFFIVLLGFFLITIVLAAYLPLMRSTLTGSIAPKLKRATAASMRITKSTAVPTYCKDIAGIVIRERKLSDVDLAPEWFHEYHRCYQFYRRMRKILRQSFIVIVHESLIYEMRLPRDKWVLMKMLKHLYFPGKWRISTFLCDIVRFLFLPVWAVLIVAVLVYVVVLDGVVWILWLVLSTFHSICVALQSIRKGRL
ncbi:hypothetical protein IQ07DRAFT_313783 [Pyrenochaeta sp. DS3sAY3a]|nr:hypothetical protein IQ07DRAFT_313783 [Pyrenochaeta sp. DS3sAY3a]